MSENERIEINSELLVARLNEVTKFVPFYKSISEHFDIGRITLPEDLKKFPLITKHDLQSDIDKFVDIRYKNKFFIATTGGTTGKQTKLYLSNECYSIEWAYVNYLLLKNGINPDSRRISLRGVSGIPFDSLLGYNYLYKEILISPFKLTEASLKQNIRKLIDFRAEWIHGYPSSVAVFARLIKLLGVRLPNIKGVLLVSEKIYEDQKAIIVEVFGAKIISFYGMSERSAFAHMLEDGSFNVQQTYGAIEVVDSEAVSTGFINKATSLIRFRTGDIIDTPLESGLVTKVDRFIGRWGREYLTGFSGCEITMTALNTHSIELDTVNSYQFVQNVIGYVTLNVTCDRKLNNSELNRLANVFQSKVGTELIISCCQVDSIPLTQRGKHVFIISNI